MRLTAILIALAIMAICATAIPSSDTSVILGVLEDGPADVAGRPNTRTVRVVFKKSGSDWVPFRSDCHDLNCLKSVAAEYPPVVTWTVAFDGKALGQITGHTPDKFHGYWRVGQQQITSKSLVPTVGRRSAEFSGFLGSDVYRPLAAVSQQNVSDPETWKPGTLSQKFTAALRREFRKHYPKLCRSAGTGALQPFLYHDAEVKIIKSYTAKSGWALARLHLEEALDCDDTEAGFAGDDPWFVVHPQGSVKYLASGMWLVDAGDYDNDGKSELVFSVNEYNRGGYRIFYDEFRKHAEFAFSYH
jgi:hypothetical protein